MKNRSKSDVPARLIRGRERFDKFRKKHKGYRRLPESLWSAAVKLAQTYGVNRTARTVIGRFKLGHYGRLQNRSVKPALIYSF